MIKHTLHLNKFLLVTFCCSTGCNEISAMVQHARKCSQHQHIACKCRDQHYTYVPQKHTVYFTLATLEVKFETYVIRKQITENFAINKKIVSTHWGPDINSNHWTSGTRC